MLLLTRRENEIISIDNRIYLKVVEIKNSQVCLGVHAPTGMHILRTELLSDTQQKLISKNLEFVNSRFSHFHEN